MLTTLNSPIILQALISVDVVQHATACLPNDRLIIVLTKLEQSQLTFTDLSESANLS